MTVEEVDMINVRYIVDDVDVAVRFYTERLGFAVVMHAPADFAMLDREGLRLLLNRPGAGGAGRSDDRGRPPEPGGWNRFQLAVPDLDEALAELDRAGVPVRTGVVGGGGGRQAVIEDPAGNPIELFEPKTNE
ncbi:VOC family protein [Nocardia neocaledoniensis]|uniref:VOC family protein n=1 Tax=Nocardia neocaledoniensis TaxID=236511 RepID=UPI003CC7EAB4